MRFSAKTLVLLSVLGLFCLPPHAAAGFKKWVDEDGVVHYGTTIPPQYAGQGHSELNSRGIEVNRTGRAKTAEEIAQEKELQRLRAEQRRELQEQQAQDRILLNMFRSEDDLIMMRDGKIAQVDAQIALKKRQIENLKLNLANWQEAAAARERRGQKLSQSQQENLDTTQRQIESAYATIMQKEETKQRIANTYNRDLARFRQLKAHHADTPVKPAEKDTFTPDVEGVFLCRDAAHCASLWPRAMRYAKEYATTPVQVKGERILATDPPRNVEDISMTVSHISIEGAEKLFLDVQCQDSVRGRDFCDSAAVRSIVSGFRPYLQGP
jgi:hypothetical protein